jgi:hypothetical protein
LEEKYLMTVNYQSFFEQIAKRYGNVSPEVLSKVLSPMLIPINQIDKEVKKEQGQKHFRALFTLRITEQNRELMTVGRTGKFVPQSYVQGGVWREICKGRLIQIDYNEGIALGEIYVGSSSKTSLQHALSNLTENDFLEIDQYGASAKILSGLVEHSLANIGKNSGFNVNRMSEDLAQHLGDYYNYDFEFEKNGTIKKIEVKSLWGTDTRCARLIHSLSKDYKTSSCKFKTQDIFAVSLFLRTGNINDFAFARSVSETEKPYGLPFVENHPEHVHQNPVCEIGNGKWFSRIEDVWDLE